MKTYRTHIQFKAVGVTTRARNKKEARRKALAGVGKMSIGKLVDLGNVFTDQIE